MKWGSFFKGLLVAERRAAAVAAIAGLNVKGVPVADLQAKGEQIGSDVNAVVKQFKKTPVPPSPPAA